MASSRNVAVVLAAHGAPMVSIDINVAIPAAPPTKPGEEPKIARVVEKNMLRPRDDAAVKTLERLRLLLGPPDNLKSRAGKKTREELLACCPSADLLDAEGKVIALVPRSDDEGYITNEAAWKVAKAILLAANSSMPLTVPIRYNLPTVTNVVPPNVVFVGVPCVSTSITTMFASENDLLYEWDISPNDPSFSPFGDSNKQNRKNNNNNNAAASTPPPASLQPTSDQPPPKILSTSAVLVPPPEALGKKLRFRVRINAQDSFWTEVESPIVQPTPRGFAPMPRWAHLKPKEATTTTDLRLVTYNILHDGFATSKRSRARIYPFASTEVLDINYRRARIAQELIRYDADVVALQEVGRSVFEGYLDPIMKSRGYTTRLKMKNNQSREGVALLLRRERFDVERWIEFTMNLHEVKKILAEETETLSAEEKANLEAVLADPQLEEALREVPSVALIAVAIDKLASTAAVTKKLIVGNTHLYYHGDGCHIRILQTWMITRRMEKLRQELEKTSSKENGKNDDDDETKSSSSSSQIVVGKCLLGDFNFSRTTGGYRLVTTGLVPKEHHSWLKSKKYYWGVDDDTNGAGGEAELEKEARESNEDENGNGAAAAFEEGDGEDVNAVAVEGEETENPTETTTTTTSTAMNPTATTSISTKRVFKGPSENGVALDLAIHPSSSTSAKKSNVGYLDLFAKDTTLECTNYSLWFKEVIDHIFISQDDCYFKPESEGVVKQLLVAPTMDELSQTIAIPSHMYPSDHIALVADVSLKN